MITRVLGARKSTRWSLCLSGGGRIGLPERRCYCGAQIWSARCLASVGLREPTLANLFYIAGYAPSGELPIESEGEQLAFKPTG